ncbi:protein DpdD [Mycolicibacterium sp. XJ662]
MTGQEREARWSQFVAEFFSMPNEVGPGQGNETFDALVDQAHNDWLIDSPTPIFLFARLSGQTYGYALWPQDDQGTWARDLIVAYLGSWIAFDVAQKSLRKLDQAALTLVSADGGVYRFAVASEGGGLRRVLEGVGRLQSALRSKPPRRFHRNTPVGRLIGDFLDACAAGAEATAMDLLDSLSRDHRLSRRNVSFLKLQALAEFGRWDDIEAWDELPDLLKMNRSTRASDALARFVMARLSKNATIQEFDLVKSDYGALVPTAAAIRSPAGAEYYAYWALSAGEAPGAVRDHLQSSGWLEFAEHNALLKDLLTSAPVQTKPPVGPLDRSALDAAIADGRFDTAIALLSHAEPTLDALAILKNLVVSTVSPEAFDTLRRWHDTLGEIPTPLIGEPTPAVRYSSLAQAFAVAFSHSTAPHDRTDALEACRQLGETTLMRPGAIDAFVSQISEQLPVADQYAGTLVDLLLDIERNLYSAVGDELRARPLRLLAIETWALSDTSGDRHRANRILTLLDRLLGEGISPESYDNVVDLLRAAWEPFLTDADLPMALEVIEALAAYKPDSTSSLEEFALPILARIGDHNVRRLPSMELAAAEMLASEFGLELGLTQEVLEATVEEQSGQNAPPEGTFIALYSLMESAANRAMRVLRARYPNVRVEVYSGKVASNSLRNAGMAADILVVADKAAAHAATQALTESRGGKQIDYARGKGTMSLLDAVDRGLQRLTGTSTAAA